MGTAKRERQKANRQLRLQELAAQARREKTKRVGLRVGLGLVAVVAIVGIAVWLGGGNDNKSAATTTVPATTLEPITTTTVDYGPVPAKPTVTLPAALPTELKVTTLREGTGEATVAGDTVAVYYVGVLSADGTEFDENYTKGGGPFSTIVGPDGQVIAGWQQGLVGVKLGGQYQLDIPASLAYKDQGAGDVIKPGDALTFVVDIVGITTADGTAHTLASTDTTVTGSDTSVADTTAATEPPTT